MMSQSVLRSEAAHYAMLQSELKASYADLDDETLADTLEGLSDLPDMIEEMVRSALDDEAMVQALKARMEVMGARLSRLKARQQKKRALAAWALGAAGLGTLKACDFTVSLCEGALRLEVDEAGHLPPRYYIPQPAKLDKAAISEALKQGETIEGARLVQGQPYIAVSVK